MSMWLLFVGASASDYAAELRRIRGQIRRVGREIKRLKAKEEDLIRRVELYEKKRDLLKSYLQVLKEQENVLRVRLRFTDKQLRDLNREERGLLRKVRAGINLLYVLKVPSVWSAIFNPRRAYAMYERATITEATLHAYRNALLEIEGFRRDYRWWKRRREEILSEIRGNIAEQESTLVEIERTERELKEAAAKVRRSRKAKERYVARLKAKARKLESLLKRLARKSKKIRAKEGSRLKGRLMWPVSGRVVRGFGYYTDPKYGVRIKSSGIEIAAPYGKGVVAADRGKVVYAGRLEGYGNVVILEHDGFFTVYANLRRVSVRLNEKVKRGQKIGEIGRRPLHFEVRLGSGRKAVDPMKYLPR